MEPINIKIEDNAIVGELLVSCGIGREQADSVVTGLNAIHSVNDDLKRIAPNIIFKWSIEAPGRWQAQGAVDG
jgi:hypothetical protein